MRPSKRLSAVRDAFAPLEPSGIRYNVDISEAGEGRFLARCRETGLEVVSPNAERDICRILAEAGAPDAPVQFWRGQTPSLPHSSIHVMGRYRIALGDKFPSRVKRKVVPQISIEPCAGSSQTAFVDLGATTLAKACPAAVCEEIATPPRAILHLKVHS
jgi:hypothetical protein